MAAASTRSPWDDPPPNFKEVPADNPKTNKPVLTYVCSICGGAVISRRRHLKWHKDLPKSVTWP